MVRQRSLRLVSATVAIAGVALAIMLALPMMTDEVPPGEILAPQAPVAMNPAPAQPAKPVDAEPAARLTPPAPPAVADAQPVQAVRLGGRWVAEGQTLTIVPGSGDAFAVTLERDGAVQTYDAVLRDGRLQLTMGIDSEWIQSIAGNGPRPCLMLGSTQRFCREG